MWELMSPEEITQNRDVFYRKIEEFAKKNGLNKSLDCILGYKNQINPRIILQAGIVAHKSSRESVDLELSFVESQFRENSSDVYICLAYCNSLFSAGRLEDSKRTLLEFYREYKRGDFHERSVSLLLNMGFVDDAKKLNDRFESLRVRLGNTEESLNDLRLKKSFFSNRAPKLSDFGVDIQYINLDVDCQKKAVLESVYQNYDLIPKRIPALLGRALPDVVKRLVDPESVFSQSPGSLGCALSHVRAWELAANNDMTLILEDDGLPFYDFSQDLLAMAEQLSELDLMFVNERMSSLRGSDIVEAGFVKPSTRLRGMPDSQKGWGGDGYILSKRGAEKLLDSFDVDKVCGHIDGHIGSYCVGGSESADSRALKTALSFRRRFKSGLELESRALNFPFVHQVNFGFSSRLAR